MNDKDSSPHLAALQELEAALNAHRRTQAKAGDAFAQAEPAAPEPRRWGFRIPQWRWRMPFDPRALFGRRHPVVRRIVIGVAAVVAVLATGGGLLAWRLASGPIMLDLATPWLISAVERNLGNRYRVAVGGTQLERDAQGRTALRLRDIVLRDLSGLAVAVAPKAEVGISGTSLLFASPRAESFRLVDANVTVRIDPDGQVNVLVGGERPFVTIAPTRALPPQEARGDSSQSPSQPGRPQSVPEPGATGASRDLSLQAMVERGLSANLTALLDGIGRLGGLEPKEDGAGFDGQSLTDIGFTNGSLDIDDRRDGHRWKLAQISLHLSRPKAGGATLAVLSESAQRPWSLKASLTPRAGGLRHLQVQASKVVLDDLLALRMAEGRIRSDTLISASIASDVAADGTPQSVSGSIVAEGGSIGDPAEPEHLIAIDNAEFGLDWDIARRTLRVPFKFNSGAARLTLRAEFAAPSQPGGPWMFGMGGGWVVLDPLTPEDEALVLKRVVMRGSFDPTKQQVTLEHGDIGSKDLGGKQDGGVTVAVSGKFDYSGEPRLALGIACNPMSAAALKRLWPAFLSPKVRTWVLDHIVGGNVERLDIATNATLAALRPGAPMPEEGLSIEIAGSSATVRPVAGLPQIRDLDINVRVTGRSAKVMFGKGVIDVSPGRKLAVSNGVFDVPNTRTKAPPARISFRVDGTIPAAAELLAMDRLREFSGAPFDPSTTRGNVAAQVQLSLPLRPDLPPGSTDYDIAVDLTNFSADKMLFGQKVEAQTLRVTANKQSYEIKGEARVAGAPAVIEYRRARGESDAEVKLQASLDEGARARLGFDLGTALAGSMPTKITGRVGLEDREGRFNVEADLTSLRVDNLIPGWVKPPGRAARLAFTLVRDKNSVRFDDLLLDGQGVLAKGSVELDGNNELQAANFPVLATSDGDKVSLKADRGADGALRVVLRGDVYDGRNFVKSAMSGPADPKGKGRYPDLDLDIKLGVVAGYYGETIRGLEWRMSRRHGRVRTFSLNAKLGRDTPLVGDIRTRISNGRPVLYFETGDAGALFRFTDVYQRMVGGKMWLGMDPPSQDAAPQEGIINVSSFSIRGEGALDRVVSGQPNSGLKTDNIEFSQARADFARSPGRMQIKDGVLRGPIIGATVEGNIDYVRDQVNVRGTLVPLYGLNNMFGQIPIVGLFLGGGNEGIFGITYEVTGPTGNPRPMVNPISAIAPGLLRKFFEFRDNGPGVERSYADPTTR